MINNLDFLRKNYINSINPQSEEIKNTLKNISEVSNEPSFISRPNEVLETVWGKMSVQQKYRVYYEKMLKRWHDKVKSGIINLESTDLLRIMYPEKSLSLKSSQAVAEVLNYSDFNELNYTIPSLIDYIDSKVNQNNPIKVRMTHCINRGLIYRSKAYALGLQGLTNQQMSRFSDGVEIRGWHQARALMKKSSHDIQLEIFLGDMDYYILEDDVESIFDENSQILLKQEMINLKEDTQEKANNFFQGFDVKISLWSERYNKDDFNTQYKLIQNSKENLGNTINKVLNERKGDYFRLWGYKEMAKSIGVSFEKLEESIRNDLYRMTAQYKLESELSKEDDCIQAISEASSNVTMPLAISHALRTEITPFLFIGAVDNYSKTFDIVD